MVFKNSFIQSPSASCCSTERPADNVRQARNMELSSFIHKRSATFTDLKDRDGRPACGGFGEWTTVEERGMGADDADGDGRCAYHFVSFILISNNTSLEWRTQGGEARLV